MRIRKHYYTPSSKQSFDAEEMWTEAISEEADRFRNQLLQLQ